MIVWAGFGGSTPVHVAAQDADVSTRGTTDESTDTYLSAVDLLPSSVVGLVQIPDVPEFCQTAETTHIGEFLDDPALQPFFDAQRQRARDYIKSANEKIGLTVRQLYDVASGEAVFAYVPVPSDRRRPSALCASVDVRGRADAVAEVLAQIDRDLKSNRWSRSDTPHRGQTIRVYTQAAKPGQLRIEQIVLHHDGDRLIATDHDVVARAMIDAVAGDRPEKTIAQDDDFRSIQTRAADAVASTAGEAGCKVAARWFARPFAMGRVIRDTFKIDRGDKVNILRLLETHGFDVFRAAGGIVLVGGDPYDWLHHGYVLATPNANNAGDDDPRYRGAAKMVHFGSRPIGEIPDWVPPQTSAMTNVHFDVAAAFWASEPMVNDVFRDDVFRNMIDGAKNDPKGAQIDLENDVLPTLDDDVWVIRDTKLPVTSDSQRVLGAIRLKDYARLAPAFRRLMDFEQTATKLDAAAGIDAYRMQPEEDPEFGDIETDIFDFDDDEPEDDASDQQPLLDHWAIGIVRSGGDAGDYLLVASHDAFLLEIATRIQAGTSGETLAADPDVQTLQNFLREMAGPSVAGHNMLRMRLSFRPRYDLLRQGKLLQSDSIGASIIRRFVQSDTLDPDDVRADLLPPFEKIERHFPNGAMFFETIDDGFSMTGFFLK